jgi:hypothetical protein
MKIRLNIRIATIPPKMHINKNLLLLLLLLFSDIDLLFKRRIRKKMNLFLGGRKIAQTFEIIK